ncbi:MAG: alkaline phosphatase D family protein [Phycisphaerales bacterium JB040]
MRRSRPRLVAAVLIPACMSSLAGAGAGPGQPVRVDPGATLTRIAFGSCARERREQPVWDDILATDPELFLFIGDNQYADFWEKDGEMVMEPVPGPARILEAYLELGTKPGYQALRARCPILATWDDHDYGANDAGSDFAFRAESQELFAGFFGLGADHPVRNGQEGVYQRYTFGPVGRRLQVILLDTRYHRDPLDRASERPRGLGPYTPTEDETRTMLGEAQWAWLEECLREPAEIRLIASSVQVVAWEHGWETWGNMPHERQRLYDLIDETDASGVFFISGDRHLMEISADRGLRGAEVPYPMWDFTSSGMTEDGVREVVDPNSYRVGPVHRRTNFGLIEIDWGQSGGEPSVSFEGYAEGGTLLTRQTVFLSELRED